MLHLRRVRPGDVAALSDICLRTADHGADATGVLDDDEIWGAVFAVPYAQRHPEFAFVVAGDDEQPHGYVVATPDTDDFEAWFRDVWWPRFADRWPEPAADDTSRRAGILRYAFGRRPGAEPHARRYPAHLHIDLLPSGQGQGWGRRLIEREFDELRAAGVSGLHLGTSAQNTGALAFYDRLGFERLPSGPGSQDFGIEFTVH